MINNVKFSYQQDCPGLPDALFAGCSGIRLTSLFNQSFTTHYFITAEK